MTLATTPTSASNRYRAITIRDLNALVDRGLPADQVLTVRAIASVLPFRTNSYVIDQLIDWAAAPDDRMYRLTFPQPGMLAEPDLNRMIGLIRSEAPTKDVQAAAHEIRMRLNPHPSGQLDVNTPVHEGRRLDGLQHKYAETVLIFPRPGQTCHAYCTYCFRWAQFVGEPDLHMATNDMDSVVSYLTAHPEVTSVLITGGDPLIMGTSALARFVEPLLAIDSIESIRLGTKALSFWPYRFLTDRDADDLMRLFERVHASGKQLALMAHFSHPRELETEAVRQAIARVRQTGAIIRCQAPLIRGVNDAPELWAKLWTEGTKLGVLPYYLFVERDTGPQSYFAVPLARGHEIFRDAYAMVNGLARTARGPIMSSMEGKVSVDGIIELNGEKAFVLHYVQARDPRLVNRPFFAAYDPDAIWMTDLKPAFGATTLGPST